MDGYGYGQRPYGVDRRTEIVSGKGFGVGASQIYATRSGSPDLPPPPPPLPAASAQASRTSANAWGLSDAEMKRKKRVARYKAYTVEGKVKSTLKKGLRWIKNKCSQIVNGY